MFDTLFGAEMPLAVRFFLAFLIVLGLIGATAWAVRRFGTGRLGGAGARGRQPRLAVIDYASVDGRRRLILVRRDNVEHLMMIGGPTDVVVEANIVRAVAAPRDLPGARPTAGIEALPRAIPLPESGNGSSWPLAPEPAGARPAARHRAIVGRIAAAVPRRRLRPFQPHGEPRPQRKTLAALADELSPRPTPSRRRPDRARPARRAASGGARRDRVPNRAKPHCRRRPLPLPPRPRPIKAWPTWRRAWNRRCASPTARRPPPRARQRPSRMCRPRPRRRRRRRAAPQQRPARPSEAKRPDAKPGQNKSTLYDSLEQEMASLLGRPTKT